MLLEGEKKKPEDIFQISKRRTMQLFCSSRVGVSNPLTGQRLSMGMIGAKTCLGLFNGQLCLSLLLSAVHQYFPLFGIDDGCTVAIFLFRLGSVWKQRLSHTTHP